MKRSASNTFVLAILLATVCLFSASFSAAGTKNPVITSCSNALSESPIVEKSKRTSSEQILKNLSSRLTSTFNAKVLVEWLHIPVSDGSGSIKEVVHFVVAENLDGRKIGQLHYRYDNGNMKIGTGQTFPGGHQVGDDRLSRRAGTGNRNIFP